jgi:hypothetical protein
MGHDERRDLALNPLKDRGSQEPDMGDHPICKATGLEPLNIGGKRTRREALVKQEHKKIFLIRNSLRLSSAS